MLAEHLQSTDKPKNRLHCSQPSSLISTKLLSCRDSKDLLWRSSILFNLSGLISLTFLLSDNLPRMCIAIHILPWRITLRPQLSAVHPVNGDLQYYLLKLLLLVLGCQICVAFLYISRVLFLAEIQPPCKSGSHLIS